MIKLSSGPVLAAGRLHGLRSRLRDERSGRVVFVSHCLLNQNTRYLGGAFRPGVVHEVIDPYLRDGTGICQMPCPEQLAWGGVLKRHLLHLYGRPWLGPGRPGPVHRSALRRPGPPGPPGTADPARPAIRSPRLPAATRPGPGRSSGGAHATYRD